MAATYLDITMLPLNTIAGFPHRFRVTARNVDGSVDAGFVGAVTFSTLDPEARLPAVYTYVGGDAGVRDFQAIFNNVGDWTLSAVSGALVGSADTTTAIRPPGWGFDDRALLPYGDAASSIGASLVKAIAYSTREVDITVSNFVQDNSPFLAGDALNPVTWSVQRLDDNAYLNVVSVEQVGTYTYRLLCLEEFGPVSVTHRVNTSTLLDDTGGLVRTPRNADFLGLLAETEVSFDTQLANQRVAVRDLANVQAPGFATAAGTMQIEASGDYRNVTGTELTKKLLIRRLISSPGDFFHLKDYGAGLRNKEPLPTQDLPKLKKRIEAQALLEREVESARCTLTLDPSNNMLIVQLRAVEKKTGQKIEVGFQVNESGVVF